MTEPLKPFSNADTFFRKEHEAPKARFRFPPQINDPSDRRFCRWCLEPIFEETPRSIHERGQIRTRLMMADNGSEIACCDNCWHGAIGAGYYVNGQVVPAQDPNEIPNPLLRKLVEDAK